MPNRDAGQLQTVAKAILTPIFRFAWRVNTEGIGNIPRSGGCLVAANHTSVLDSFFVPLTVRRRITFVGKAEYLDDWKTRFLFPAMGMIPIDRSGGDASAAALDAAASVLERNELFGIYPEGTRSRTGMLHKGHTGVARLALRTGCPILPVGIVGSADIQPCDAKVPRPFKELTVRFGAPIDVSRYADRANDRLVLRQITDEVMFEIAGLSGQEYVDSYATKRHESIPAEPAVIGASEPVDLSSATQVEPADGEAAAPVEARSSSSVLQSRPMVDLLG